MESKAQNQARSHERPSGNISGSNSPLNGTSKRSRYLFEEHDPEHTRERNTRNAPLVPLIEACQLSGWYGEAAHLILLTQSCLRVWVMTDFSKLYDDDGSEIRGDLNGELSEWRILDGFLMQLYHHALNSSTLAELHVKFLEVVRLEIDGMTLKNYHTIHRLLQHWFSAYADKRDDAYDTYKAYAHTTSFIYIDELICGMIAIYEEAESTSATVKLS